MADEQQALDRDYLLDLQADSLLLTDLIQVIREAFPAAPEFLDRVNFAERTRRLLARVKAEMAAAPDPALLRPKTREAVKDLILWSYRDPSPERISAVGTAIHEEYGVDFEIYT